MRLWPALGVSLLAASALPAAAGGGGHVSSASHPHSAGHFSHFRHFRFNGFNGFNTFGFTSSGRFGRSRAFSRSGWNWGWGWGLADWDNWDGWPAGAGAPGTVIFLAGAPSARPAPPSTPANATVETQAGVTVYRGPGSHHLARY